MFGHHDDRISGVPCSDECLFSSPVKYSTSQKRDNVYSFCIYGHRKLIEDLIGTSEHFGTCYNSHLHIVSIEFLLCVSAICAFLSNVIVELKECTRDGNPSK